METTTITQKSFRNNNNNNNGGGRRSGRRARSKSVVKTVSFHQQPSNKTLRNRRRRQRNKQNRLMGAPLMRSYYNRYSGNLVDPTMASSVHKMIQTQFYPQQGIYRGISNGLEMTGITAYQGSFEMNTGATNNVLTFVFTPGLFAKPAAQPDSNFFNWIVSTTVIDPDTGTNPIYAIPGPFSSTNPMAAGSSGRVVSATLNIIPASTVLNRGGEGKLGYASSVSSLTWTRTDIDNLSISRSWDGIEAMSLHWTPGVKEYEFSNGTSLYDWYSGICGYIAGPTGTAVTWRVEWQVGIEYIPNATYRPLIDRKAPKIRPDARYFLNETVQEHWTPLMISTLANYQSRLSASVSLGGHTPTQFFDHSGMGGVGFNNLNAAEQAAAYEEFEDDGFVNVIGRTLKGAGKTACDITSNFVGEDICGDPIGALGGMAGRFTKGVSRGLTPRTYALM